MIFCPGKLTETDYATPYGNLSMSLNTSLASYELTEEGICARIEYTLSLNGSFVSVNQLNIECIILLTLLTELTDWRNEYGSNKYNKRQF